MFFTKPEYKEVSLPFTYHEDLGDLDAGILSMEFYGMVLDQNKYFYISYFVDIDFIDELANKLKNNSQKEVNIKFKIKNDKIKSFDVNLEDLANVCNDVRFKTLTGCMSGINDESFSNIERKDIYKKDRNA